MSKHLYREVVELHQYRVHNKLPFRVLAEQVGVSLSVLHKSLSRACVPSEITLHAMRMFLDTVKKRQG